MKKIDTKGLTLSQRFGNLFDYLITRRTYLIESGLSQRPDSIMRSMIDKFRPYKGMHWTDEGAAKFIWKHYAELRELLPPRETKISEEIENLWLAAKIYQINSTPKHQPWNLFESAHTS